MKEEIINWIKNIERIDGIPPKEVLGFNFGIFETETGYSMYLVGSFEYDENDDDWASVEPPKGQHRYLTISLEKEPDSWESVLKYCANILRELENEGKLNIPMLENAVAVTTGFDEGELIRIR